MDNLHTHSEDANQPQEEQADDLPMDGTNLAPFSFSLEQHRLQNEQVRVSLQQEVSLQNATLLCHLTTDALIQKVEAIASLHIELQRTQEGLETANQLVVMAYETRESIIRRLSPVQQETNSHVSSNQLDAQGSGDEASSAARIAGQTTKINLGCKVCNSDRAYMLLLPCKHLCACKACEARLVGCPMCGAVKGDAIEARFG